MKCYNRDCKYNDQGDIDNCSKASIVLDREGKCLDFCPLDYVELNYPPGVKSFLETGIN